MNQTVSSSSRARDDYRLGLVFFRKRQWRAAARHFGLAQRRAARDDEYLNVYASCQGLSLIRCGDPSGLNQCRHAAGRERVRPEVFVNLVLAELRFRHRRRAWEALCRGLALDPDHPVLHKLARKMDRRRRPAIGFLKREHPLNKWLGKATWRLLKRPGRRRA